jgi:hypothetical protein
MKTTVPIPGSNQAKNEKSKTIEAISMAMISTKSKSPCGFVGLTLLNPDRVFSPSTI